MNSGCSFQLIATTTTITSATNIKHNRIRHLPLHVTGKAEAATPTTSPTQRHSFSAERRPQSQPHHQPQLQLQFQFRARFLASITVASYCSCCYWLCHCCIVVIMYHCWCHMQHRVHFRLLVNSQFIDCKFGIYCQPRHYISCGHRSFVAKATALRASTVLASILLYAHIHMRGVDCRCLLCIALYSYGEF